MSALVEDRAFVESFRRRKSAAFDLEANSTAGRTVPVDFWGAVRPVYANANLSLYSGQRCNARCPFCVEELRPASRGGTLVSQKRVETDDARYFAALEEVLRTVRPLDPSVSVTGGEPSKDPRLPLILRTIAAFGSRKRTMTTNGSGLLDAVEGKTVAEWVVATGLRHLNVSRAHVDQARNSELMGLSDQLSLRDLESVARFMGARGTRVRLSCVLLREGISDLDGIVDYVGFAQALGVRDVIFRQLMKSDPLRHAANSVVRYSDAERVPLEPLLDEISGDRRFTFVKQIVGYYYYVEVHRFGEMNVVFEEADLARLEKTKETMPDVVHELVFHPEGRLASTWQPWDDVLGPR